MSISKHLLQPFQRLFQNNPSHDATKLSAKGTLQYGAEYDTVSAYMGTDRESIRNHKLGYTRFPVIVMYTFLVICLNIKHPVDVFYAIF